MNAFLNGRGMGLFSLLFAVGLSIQMERAQARGAGFWPFAFRRLGALALIGLVHALVIWNGDILVPYAIIGLMILPLLRASPRTLVLVLILSLALSLTYGDLLHGLNAPEGLFFSHWMKQSAWLKQMADQAYGQGTWWQAAQWRFWEWANPNVSVMLIALFECLPIFISGLLLWRSGLLQNAAGRRPFLRRSFHVLFWPSILIMIATYATDWIPEASWSFLGGIPIGLSMALTTYLTQSLVFTWIFCGYGAGLWNRLSVSAVFWIGMAFFAVQIFWSRWWLGSFRFGPAEWLWRSMTYGRWQRLRVPNRQLPISTVL